MSRGIIRSLFRALRECIAMQQDSTPPPICRREWPFQGSRLDLVDPRVHIRTNSDQRRFFPCPFLRPIRRITRLSDSSTRATTLWAEDTKCDSPLPPSPPLLGSLSASVARTAATPPPLRLAAFTRHYSSIHKRVFSCVREESVAVLGLHGLWRDARISWPERHYCLQC